jgi:type IV secretion system protein VirB6
MGFFAEFSTWLDTLLSGYIGSNTARLANILEPAVVTLGVVYLMIWGYLLLAGKIEEPLVQGLKRIFTLAVVLGVALRLWLYNELIVDTFFSAPAALGAQVIGAYDSVGIVDQILFSGNDAGTLLLQKGGLFDGNFTYYIAGFAVYLMVGLTAVYTMFLLALSKIALSILLALGPLFVVLILFDSTKRFFESWIAQLANYAFITILSVLVAALMMHLLQSAADQAVAAAGGITIAAALASGFALSSFGVVSAAVAWGLGAAKGTGGNFLRGLVMDRETTRWDPISRKSGYALQRGLVAGGRQIAKFGRGNVIRRRQG